MSGGPRVYNSNVSEKEANKIAYIIRTTELNFVEIGLRFNRNKETIARVNKKFKIRRFKDLGVENGRRR